MINGTIWLDGRHEIIRNVDDFVKLVKEHMGDDAARMAQTLADLTDKAAHLAQTDFESYERALDGMSAAMRDIQEAAAQIQKLLDERRLDREVIRKLVCRILTEVVNQL